MIVAMQEKATEEQIDSVINAMVEAAGGRGVRHLDQRTRRPSG